MKCVAAMLFGGLAFVGVGYGFVYLTLLLWLSFDPPTGFVIWAACIAFSCGATTIAAIIAEAKP